MLPLPRAACLACLATVLGAARAAPLESPLRDASWVWGAADEEECHLRAEITLPAVPREAAVWITADNSYALYVNGAEVGGDEGAGTEVWQSVERHDLTKRLAAGRNVIGIHAWDLGGVRGAIAALRARLPDGKELTLVTDAGWRSGTGEEPRDYSHPEHQPGPAWTPVHVLGREGMAPWGALDAASTPAPRKAARPYAGEPRVVEPAPEFNWPGPIAFVDGDCSVYVPRRGDAWGVAFRVGDYSRAYTEFDLPCPAKIGRRLLRLIPGRDAAPSVLLDAGQGVLGSPSAAYDGKSVLVSLAPAGESFYHVYRVPLEGAPPVALTDGPYHDLDPVELPDGRILFSSTRAGTFEEYHQPPSRALFRMNADGTAIHPVTSTLIFDNEPKVMANGRVVFVRTDNFFDRGKVETQLHSIRPDGTDGQVELGANVGAQYGTRLRAHGYGSPAPLPDGGLACLSNRGNRIAPPGSPEQAHQPLPGGLGDLAPLPDGRLLATPLRTRGPRVVSDRIAVFDPASNELVCVHDAKGESVHSPVSLAPRPRPPVIPDYADPAPVADPTGFLFCRDARFTTKDRAGWDRVRAIRVLGARPLTVRSSHSHIVHVGHETVELGTVPLAEDGSFHAEVPADMPLALQAVDAEGRVELNEMSWIYVRPGERRSCTGCHQPRESAPPVDFDRALALLSPPPRLLGQGDPHRFRGNNSAVNGLMDLQIDRFRHCASLNRASPATAAGPDAAGGAAAWLKALDDADPSLRVSAAQRLALLDSPCAGPALARVLDDPAREVRLAAALALATCGGRAEISALVDRLGDPDATVARAVRVALENLVGHDAGASAHDWRAWLARNPWDAWEKTLAQTAASDLPEARSAVIALGHLGGPAARGALRARAQKLAAAQTYPPFEQNNRTDRFTFSADSPLNPRPLQETVRALGRVGAAEDIPFLADLAATHRAPRDGNLYVVEAALDAITRIGGAAAPEALAKALVSFEEYWKMVGWYGDHPALYACHSSPPHARALLGLDALGAGISDAATAAAAVRSLPTDPDRALFPASDDYEETVGRLLRRGGREAAWVDTCLALLGEPSATADPVLREALSRAHTAWAGTPGPSVRAAQVLSAVCRDPAAAPRVRAAYQRALEQPEGPVARPLGNPTSIPDRHWILFYLGRTLGNLRDAGAAPLLASVLADDRNEARLGRPNPAEPNLHFLHLDYTPCWRAAAAWALGRVGDASAKPALRAVVGNLDNALDTRHCAAVALAALMSEEDRPELARLAAGTQDVSVRNVLRRAAERRPAPASPTPRLPTQASLRNAP